jgi:hypothetical protein
MKSPRADLKLPAALEEAEQAAVIEWCDLQGYPYNLINGSMNGVRLTIGQSVKAKKAGMRKGYPDLFLPHAVGEYHGFYCELKRKSGSVTSEDQKDWKRWVEREGYAHVYAYGCDEAIEFIKDYVKGAL